MENQAHAERRDEIQEQIRAIIQAVLILKELTPDAYWLAQTAVKKALEVRVLKKVS